MNELLLTLLLYDLSFIIRHDSYSTYNDSWIIMFPLTILLFWNLLNLGFLNGRTDGIDLASEIIVEDTRKEGGRGRNKRWIHSILTFVKKNIIKPVRGWSLFAYGWRFNTKSRHIKINSKYKISHNWVLQWISHEQKWLVEREDNGRPDEKIINQTNSI